MFIIIYEAPNVLATVLGAFTLFNILNNSAKEVRLSMILQMFLKISFKRIRKQH